MWGISFIRCNLSLYRLYLLITVISNNNHDRIFPHREFKNGSGKFTRISERRREIPLTRDIMLNWLSCKRVRKPGTDWTSEKHGLLDDRVSRVKAHSLVGLAPYCHGTHGICWKQLTLHAIFAFRAAVGTISFFRSFFKLAQPSLPAYRWRGISLRSSTRDLRNATRRIAARRTRKFRFVFADFSVVVKRCLSQS